MFRDIFCQSPGAGCCGVPWRKQDSTPSQIVLKVACGLEKGQFLGPDHNILWSVLVTQSCLTLWNPMDRSLPGSSIRGLLQARIPEWVVIPFSRKSAQPWDWTWVSCIASGFFTVRATRKAVIFFERAPRFSLILPFYTRDSGPCRFSLAQLSSPRFLNHLFADAWGLFDSSKPGDTTMSRTSLPTSLQGFWGPLCTGTTSHGLRLTHAAPALSLPGTFLPVLSF